MSEEIKKDTLTNEADVAEAPKTTAEATANVSLGTNSFMMFEESDEDFAKKEKEWADLFINDPDIAADVVAVLKAGYPTTVFCRFMLKLALAFKVDEGVNDFELLDKMADSVEALREVVDVSEFQSKVSVLNAVYLGQPAENHIVAELASIINEG